MYHVIPVGSHSFVRCLDNGAELPLFGSGGFKPFGHKKLDEGICAFMECFCQLQRHIERTEVIILSLVLLTKFFFFQSDFFFGKFMIYKCSNKAWTRELSFVSLS